MSHVWNHIHIENVTCVESHVWNHRLIQNVTVYITCVKSDVWNNIRPTPPSATFYSLCPAPHIFTLTILLSRQVTLGLRCNKKVV